jgi:hypothetical protein
MRERRPAHKSTERPSRASARPQAVHIDAAHRPLMWLMTEQCRSDSGYMTVYRASREELLAVGVPEAAFPAGRAKRAEFDIQLTNVCCTGRTEKVTGAMMAVEGGLELEIRWGHVRPYSQAAHPALTELARMMLKDIMRWTDDYRTNSLEQPFAVLENDPRATDFKPIEGARRFKVTPEFHATLRQAASRIYELVHSEGEIMLAEEASNRTGADSNVILFRNRKALG